MANKTGGIVPLLLILICGMTETVASAQSRTFTYEYVSNQFTSVTWNGLRVFNGYNVCPFEAFITFAQQIPPNSTNTVLPSSFSISNAPCPGTTGLTLSNPTASIKKLTMTTDGHGNVISGDIDVSTAVNIPLELEVISNDPNNPYTQVNTTVTSVEVIFSSGLGDKVLLNATGGQFVAQNPVNGVWVESFPVGTPLTIVSSLPSGTENVPYPSTATVSGGVSPTVTVSGLPAGLTADASGNISGTPATGTAANSPYHVSISASDSAGDQAGPASIPLTISHKNCAVPVALIRQSTLPWGPTPYDHLGKDSKGKQITIGGRGCALTSLNMALNFEGENWNPGTLNSLLNATGGYGPQGWVAWPTATLASNGGRVGTPLIYDTLGTVDSDVDLEGAVEKVEDEVCASTPLPVIVGVRSQVHKDKYPGHFVLITGETVASDGSKFFTINDPAGYSTILGTDPSTGESGYTNGDGDPEFQTRGVVHDPIDLTELSVGVDAIVNLIVTDPKGLQTGFGPASPNPIQNIPHSAATVDEIDDDVTGEAGNPVQGVTINSPAPGVFQFSLTGSAAGQYTLVISSGAADGTVQTSSISGFAKLGSIANYELTYDSTPGKSQSLTVMATFASTLADITNALQLGLINNRGIADLLSQTIKAAQHSNGPLRIAILGAFKLEVKAESGKHVTGIAPQVLLQDAASLISQINPK